MKLVRVYTRITPSPVGTDLSSFFVVASDPTAAYEAVREHLDRRNLGFADDRELESVRVLAEATEYPACRTILLLPGK